MIIDRLQNAGRYFGINRRLARALRFLQKKDPRKLKTGRHDIDGSNIYAMVFAYTTKPKRKGVWEAHRRYIDVQYVASGAELIGYANVKEMRAGRYDPKSDFLPLKGQGVLVPARAGTFVILMPQDAHMPGMADGSPRRVKKIVLKVRAGRK